MKTSKQMWRDAEDRSFAINRHFLELWNHPTNPLTRSDLRKLIKRNPTIWKRFSHYLTPHTPTPDDDFEPKQGGKQ